MEFSSYADKQNREIEKEFLHPGWRSGFIGTVF